MAIARGTDKEELARELGAHEYIDSTAGDPGEALMALGGAKVILSTISSGEANTAVIGGLGPRGELIVVGASPDPIEAAPFALIGANRSIAGHASGTSIDSAGHAGVQLAHRRAAADRDAAAGAGRRRPTTR